MSFLALEAQVEPLQAVLFAHRNRCALNEDPSQPLVALFGDPSLVTRVA